MERKVGEIFEYNGEWYQCVEQPKQYDCATVFELCAFSAVGNCELDKCSGTYRSDGKSVIFKKLEKVGEPIRIENKSYQKIKVPHALCDHCAFYDNFSRNCKLSYYINHYPAYSCLKDEMFVEIKENKEDMNKKKLNLKKLIKKLNLKEFDLEAAKAGKPVCTRDGRKVRIISFDRKFLFKGVSYPIIALVEDTAKEETIYGYNEKGKVIIENDTPYKDDLMMLPQKKEGWVNVYKSHERGNTISFIVASIYPTKEEAKKSYVVEFDYVDTVKIEWEE